MKEIKVTKTMYETIDGRCFETQAKAAEHETVLERHKEIISFAINIRAMCYKYVGEGEYGNCSSECPFKGEHDYCILDDSPYDWKLPPVDNDPS